jgi:hypothetical protein
MAKNNISEVQQLRNLVNQLQGQQQAQNAFYNSPVGKQIRKQAEQMVKTQQLNLQTKQARYNELKSIHNNSTNLSRLNGTQFVNLNGVPSMYHVGIANNEVTNFQPITMDTYKGLSQADKIAFDSKFPDVAMSIKFNAYQPQLSQEYFQNAVVTNGMDGMLLNMELNRPKLQHELDWHKPESESIRQAYGNDYQNYLKGETVEISEYRLHQSVEYRKQVVQEMNQLGDEIKGLKNELGMTSSVVDSSDDKGGNE